MSYKCTNCGHIFDYGEEIISGSDGYFTASCPFCKVEEEYEETVSCCKCFSEHLESELISGMCEDCIESLYRCDYETCYNVAKVGKEKKKIEINGFLATMFEPSAIEEILYKALKESAEIKAYFNEYIDCWEYINEDISWFVEEVRRLEDKKNKSR